MLVDSSVWISDLRGDTFAEVELLTQTLQRGAAVWLAPAILGAAAGSRFEAVMATRVDFRLPLVNRDSDGRYVL